MEAQSVATETPPQRSRVSKVTAKRLGSVWRYAAGEHLEQVRKTLASEEPPQDECIFGESLNQRGEPFINNQHYR